MNNPSTLEERLRQYAQVFPYPSTPPIEQAVRLRLAARRPMGLRPALRWALLALIVLLAASLTVPQVRAQVLEFLRIGVVRIFQAQPAPPAPIPTGTTPASQIPVTATPRVVNTPQLEPVHDVSMEGLAGETSLEAARSWLDFPIRLPAELGEPDRVFLQKSWQMVILVWLDEADPEQVRLSLHEIGPGSVIIEKFEPRLLKMTQVHDSPAAWVSGPYLVQLTNGDVTWRRLVNGNTLIWEAEGVTYRLESALTMEETVRIAESLE